MAETTQSSELEAGLELEIIEEEPRDDVPAKVEVSKEEYDRLTSMAETNQQIAGALGVIAQEKEEERAASDKAARQTVDDPFATALLTGAEGEGNTNFEDNLFEKGKAQATIHAEVNRIVKPMMQAADARANSAALRATLAEDPVAKRYEGEIKELLGQATPEQLATPGIVPFVVDKVKKAHESEIIEEKANELLAVKLKERGLSEEGEGGESTGGGTATSSFSEGLGDGPAPPKRTVRITRAQEAVLREKAAALMMDFEDYMEYVYVG